jgi:hypothetical protein
MTARTGRERPAAFVRRYAKTWVHALATAALTAFGTLTVVDERFAAVAIAAYVLPPVVLYVGGGSNGEAATTDGVVSRGDGGSWTPVRVADGPLRAVTGRGERWLACGDGGAVFERRDPSVDGARRARRGTVNGS